MHFRFTAPPEILALLLEVLLQRRRQAVRNRDLKVPVYLEGFSGENEV